MLKILRTELQDGKEKNERSKTRSFDVEDSLQRSELKQEYAEDRDRF